MSYLARICTAILLIGAGCKAGGRAVAPIDDGPPRDAKVIARVDPAGFAPAVDPVVAGESPGVAAIGPRAPTLVSESAQPFVHFARPMKADASALHFELDPPIAGETVWIDPYRAWFVPSELLVLGRSYRVHAHGTVQRDDGSEVVVDQRWELRTRAPFAELEPLQTYGFGRFDNDEAEVSTFHAKTAVDVRAELEITAAQVRPYLRARAWKAGADPSTAKPVAIRVYGGKQKHPLPEDLDEHDRNAVHVHPATSWPAGHEIEVTLDAAFAPKHAGAIGKPVLARFRVADGAHIRMTCLEDHGDGCGPMGVAFELDAPFRAADLHRIDITPRPKEFKREIWGDNHIWIYGEFELKTYRVRVPELRDRVGQKLVGSKPTELVIVPPPPTVDLVGTSGTLRPGQATTVGLESRWLQQATLRAAVPSEAEWIAMQHADLDEVPFPKDEKSRIEKRIDLGPTGPFAWSSVALDIAQLAGGKGKPLFVEIVPGPVMDVARHRPQPERVRGLYQVTELGLAAWLSPGNARVQVRSFDTLAPLPKVQLEVLDDKGKRVHTVSTGKDGFADLPRDAELTPAAMLLAKRGSDRALAAIGTGTPRTESDDELLSQIVTERAIYLPGDKVSIVGWGAISTPTSEHGLARPKPGTKVRLELKDPHGDVVVRRSVAFSEHGKYWGRLALPEQAPLGSWSAVATVGDDSFTAWFTVRDVRPPQFEVRAAARDDARTRGEKAEIVTHASYYFGGGVPITSARASSECRLRSTRPPGLAREWEVASPVRGENEPWSYTLSGEPTIEKDGTVRVVLATDELKRGTDYACATDVAVQDATFEEVGATAAWFVYPTRYLALKGTSRIDGHSWELRAVDRDGNARKVQRYEVELFRIDDERRKDGTVHDKLVRVQVCKGDTRDHGDDARCDSGKLAPGRYRAVLEAEVDETPVVWSDELWIREPPKTKPRSEVERRWLEMDVEPENPAPGQTATVTVLGPKLDAHGELAFSHLGLRRVIPFELRDGEAKLELPVTDAWIPGIELHAFAVAPGKDAKAPPQYWATNEHVNVGHESRRLTVTIDAVETTTAGAELPIAVHVKGEGGKPVRGRVAVWAVDEALHSLVAPRIPDLVAGFARGRSLPTRFVENYSKVLRPYVVRDDPFVLGGSYGTGAGFGSGSGYGTVGHGAGSGAAQSAVRQKFEGTPIFIGDAEVDAQGNAKVKGTMPDNLTTFRLTAIASADAASGPGVARFGHSDARVRVTAPLIVRAVVPRILRPGDEAQIAAMIENLGGPAGEAELEVAIVRGEKLLTIVEKPAAKVTLAAGGQAKVPLLVRARAVGKVELELRVRLPGKPELRDAVRVSLPIEAPKDLRQHAASYGSLDEDGAYAIELSKPRELERGAVDVDVEIAGTMLAGLEAMARDLAQYPYGCVEQTSSGLVPLVALRGLSHQGFLDVKVDEHVAVGLARLRAMQIDGGGLGYWPGARTVHVWGTAYALWVLELLRAEGHEVPASLRDGMRKQLSERLGLALEQSDAALPPWERLEVDPVAATMAVQALVSAGDRPTALVDALFEHRGELPTFARALLLMAAHETWPKHARTLVTELRAEIDEREGTATVRPGSTWYDEYFDSSARTDAMTLLALLKAAPDDPLIEKLARGVAELRASGGLGNTQERAYGLLALSQYARARETTIPSLTAQTWIGAQAGKRATLEGRKTTAVHSRARVESTTPPRVTVQRTGKGRLYWRVGMSWTPPDAGAKADAHGLAITRSLRTAKQTDIERVAAGELVALDVTVTVDRTQRYVAIDLPLPPGLEAVDQTLGGGARARVLPSKGGWWVSHRELRRDRAVLFADVLAPGEHTATVFLRATTPGRFEMPAAVAHAMYAPERRGHTADAKVEVTK